jgi:hypothetical protein
MDKRRQDLEKALSLPNLESDFLPQTIEFFDERGLLLSQSGAGILDCPRQLGVKSEYLAVYFDGELGFFSEGGQVLLNRIGLLARENLFWH